MMAALHRPDQNHLLAALGPADAAPLLAQLELVPMRLGDIIYEPGVPLQHAYFPTTAIVSLHYLMASGAATETSGVGNEGVVGVSLFLGDNTMPGSAVVQTAGHGYRLARHAVQREFERAGLLQRLLLRYTQALITQMMQIAVCNRHHSIEQQLCRCLLATLDRIRVGELVMTQELIASMLGVRCEGITDAVGRLQQAGYIRYRRGHITVLNRAGLEATVCECYAVVKQECQRLLPMPPPMRCMA